jgi:hypothetical protein
VKQMYLVQVHADLDNAVMHKLPNTPDLRAAVEEVMAKRCQQMQGILNLDEHVTKKRKKDLADEISINDKTIVYFKELIAEREVENMRFRQQMNV